MPPVVTEVVGVEEPVPDRPDHLIQADVALGRPFFALVDVELGEEEGRHPALLHRAGLEPVQVAIEPAHRRLKMPVQSVERQVAANLQSAPDRWL